MRIVSLFLSTVLFITNCAFAYSPETEFWKQRQAQIRINTPASPPIVQRVAKPANSVSIGSIPNQLRKFVHIREDKHKQDGPRVYLIEDIHLNEEAQRNMAGAMEVLVNSQPITVGVEGSFGLFDFSSYRALPRQDIVRLIANRFLQEGKIGAVSFAGLTLPKSLAGKLKANGIETWKNYNANVIAYRTAMEQYSDVSKQLEKRASDFTKEVANLSTPLQIIGSARRKYETAEQTLAGYLQDLAQTKSPALMPPSLQSFAEASRLESNLNFEQVKREQNALLERLAAKIDAKDLELVIAGQAQLKNDQITLSDYHRQIKNLLIRHKIEMTLYPNFRDYLSYLFLTENIDAEALYADLHDYEKAVIESFNPSADEKKILKEAEFIGLAQKLIRFALTPSEWESYKTRDHKQHLSQFERFYELADIRSEDLVKNFIAANNKVLVAGGFHTPSLKSQLTKKGYSVTVLTPRITKVNTDQGTEYLSYFLERKSPLSQLFAGRKLFMAAPETLVTHGTGKTLFPLRGNTEEEFLHLYHNLSDKKSNHFKTFLLSLTDPTLHIDPALKIIGLTIDFAKGEEGDNNGNGSLPPDEETLELIEQYAEQSEKLFEMARDLNQKKFLAAHTSLLQTAQALAALVKTKSEEPAVFLKAQLKNAKRERSIRGIHLKDFPRITAGEILNMGGRETDLDEDQEKTARDRVRHFLNAFPPVMQSSNEAKRLWSRFEGHIDVVATNGGDIVIAKYCSAIIESIIKITDPVTRGIETKSLLFTLENAFTRSRQTDFPDFIRLDLEHPRMAVKPRNPRYLTIAVDHELAHGLGEIGILGVPGSSELVTEMVTMKGILELHDEKGNLSDEDAAFADSLKPGWRHLVNAARTYIEANPTPEEQLTTEKNLAAFQAMRSIVFQTILDHAEDFFKTHENAVMALKIPEIQDRQTGLFLGAVKTLRATELKPTSDNPDPTLRLFIEYAHSTLARVTEDTKERSVPKTPQQIKEIIDRIKTGLVNISGIPLWDVEPWKRRHDADKPHWRVTVPPKEQQEEGKKSILEYPEKALNSPYEDVVMFQALVQGLSAAQQSEVRLPQNLTKNALFMTLLWNTVLTMRSERALRHRYGPAFQRMIDKLYPHPTSPFARDRFRKDPAYFQFIEALLFESRISEWDEDPRISSRAVFDAMASARKIVARLLAYDESNEEFEMTPEQTLEATIQHLWPLMQNLHKLSEDAALNQLLWEKLQTDESFLNRIGSLPSLAGEYFPLHSKRVTLDDLLENEREKILKEIREKARDLDDEARAKLAEEAQKRIAEAQERVMKKFEEYIEKQQSMSPEEKLKQQLQQLFMELVDRLENLNIQIPPFDKLIEKGRESALFDKEIVQIARLFNAETIHLHASAQRLTKLEPMAAAMFLSGFERLSELTALIQKSAERFNTEKAEAIETLDENLKAAESEIKKLLEALKSSAQSSEGQGGDEGEGEVVMGPAAGQGQGQNQGQQGSGKESKDEELGKKESDDSKNGPGEKDPLDDLSSYDEPPPAPLVDPASAKAGLTTKEWLWWSDFQKDVVSLKRDLKEDFKGTFRWAFQKRKRDRFTSLGTGVSKIVGIFTDGNFSKKRKSSETKRKDRVLKLELLILIDGSNSMEGIEPRTGKKNPAADVMTPTTQYLSAIVMALMEAQKEFNALGEFDGEIEIHLDVRGYTDLAVWGNGKKYPNIPIYKTDGKSFSEAGLAKGINRFLFDTARGGTNDVQALTHAFDDINFELSKSERMSAGAIIHLTDANIQTDSALYPSVQGIQNVLSLPANQNVFSLHMKVGEAAKEKPGAVESIYVNTNPDRRYPNVYSLDVVNFKAAAPIIRRQASTLVRNMAAKGIGRENEIAKSLDQRKGNRLISLGWFLLIGILAIHYHKWQWGVFPMIMGIISFQYTSHPALSDISYWKRVLPASFFENGNRAWAIIKSIIDAGYAPTAASTPGNIRTVFFEEFQQLTLQAAATLPKDNLVDAVSNHLKQLAPGKDGVPLLIVQPEGISEPVSMEIRQDTDMRTFEIEGVSWQVENHQITIVHPDGEKIVGHWQEGKRIWMKLDLEGTSFLYENELPAWARLDKQKVKSMVLKPGSMVPTFQLSNDVVVLTVGSRSYRLKLNPTRIKRLYDMMLVLRDKPDLASTNLQIYGPDQIDKNIEVYLLAAFLKQPVRTLHAHADMEENHFSGFDTIGIQEQHTQARFRTLVNQAALRGEWFLVSGLHNINDPQSTTAMNTLLQDREINGIPVPSTFRFIGTRDTTVGASYSGVQDFKSRTDTITFTHPKIREEADELIELALGVKPSDRELAARWTNAQKFALPLARLAMRIRTYHKKSGIPSISTHQLANILVHLYNFPQDHPFLRHIFFLEYPLLAVPEHQRESFLNQLDAWWGEQDDQGRAIIFGLDKNGKPRFSKTLDQDTRDPGELSYIEKDGKYYLVYGDPENTGQVTLELGSKPDSLKIPDYIWTASNKRNLLWILKDLYQGNMIQIIARSGTGKTTLVTYILRKLLRWDYLKAEQTTQRTTGDENTGMQGIKMSRSYFPLTPALKAVRSNRILWIEEMTKAPGAVMESLRGLLHGFMTSIANIEEWAPDAKSGDLRAQKFGLVGTGMVASDATGAFSFIEGIFRIHVLPPLVEKEMAELIRADEAFMERRFHATGNRNDPWFALSDLMVEALAKSYVVLDEAGIEVNYRGIKRMIESFARTPVHTTKNVVELFLDKNAYDEQDRPALRERLWPLWMFLFYTEAPNLAVLKNPEYAHLAPGVASLMTELAKRSVPNGKTRFPFMPTLKSMTDVATALVEKANESVDEPSIATVVFNALGQGIEPDHMEIILEAVFDSKIQQLMGSYFREVVSKRTRVVVQKAIEDFSIAPALHAPLHAWAQHWVSAVYSERKLPRLPTDIEITQSIAKFRAGEIWKASDKSVGELIGDFGFTDPQHRTVMWDLVSASGLQAAIWPFAYEDARLTLSAMIDQLVQQGKLSPDFNEPIKNLVRMLIQRKENHEFIFLPDEDDLEMLSKMLAPEMLPFTSKALWRYFTFVQTGWRTLHELFEKTGLIHAVQQQLTLTSAGNPLSGNDLEQAVLTSWFQFSQEEWKKIETSLNEILMGFPDNGGTDIERTLSFAEQNLVYLSPLSPVLPNTAPNYDQIHPLLFFVTSLIFILYGKQVLPEASTKNAQDLPLINFLIKVLVNSALKYETSSQVLIEGKAIDLDALATTVSPKIEFEKLKVPGLTDEDITTFAFSRDGVQAIYAGKRDENNLIPLHYFNHATGTHRRYMIQPLTLSEQDKKELREELYKQNNLDDLKMEIASLEKTVKTMKFMITPPTKEAKEIQKQLKERRAEYQRLMELKKEIATLETFLKRALNSLKKESTPAKKRQLEEIQFQLEEKKRIYESEMVSPAMLEELKAEIVALEDMLKEFQMPAENSDEAKARFKLLSENLDQKKKEFNVELGLIEAQIAKTGAEMKDEIFQVTAISFHPSKNSFAIGLNNGTIAVWSINPEETNQLLPEPVSILAEQDRKSPVQSILFDAERSFLYSTLREKEKTHLENTIVLWDISNPLRPTVETDLKHPAFSVLTKEKREVVKSEKTPNITCFDVYKNKLVSGDAFGRFYIWDLSVRKLGSEKPLAFWAAPYVRDNLGLTSIRILPNGHAIIGFTNRTIIEVNLENLSGLAESHMVVGTDIDPAIELRKHHYENILEFEDDPVRDILLEPATANLRDPMVFITANMGSTVLWNPTSAPKEPIVLRSDMHVQKAFLRNDGSLVVLGEPKNPGLWIGRLPVKEYQSTESKSGETVKEKILKVHQVPYKILQLLEGLRTLLSPKNQSDLTPMTSLVLPILFMGFIYVPSSVQWIIAGLAALVGIVYYSRKKSWIQNSPTPQSLGLLDARQLRYLQHPSFEVDRMGINLIEVTSEKEIASVTPSNESGQAFVYLVRDASIASALADKFKNKPGLVRIVNVGDAVIDVTSTLEKTLNGDRRFSSFAGGLLNRSTDIRIFPSTPYWTSNEFVTIGNHTVMMSTLSIQVFLTELLSQNFKNLRPLSLSTFFERLRNIRQAVESAA